MRAQDFDRGLRTFTASIKLKQKGNSPVIDTMVVARTPYLARLLLQRQYSGAIIVSNLREISN
jgi:hypothetical protein